MMMVQNRRRKSFTLELYLAQAAVILDPLVNVRAELHSHTGPTPGERLYIYG